MIGDDLETGEGQRCCSAFGLVKPCRPDTLGAAALA